MVVTCPKYFRLSELCTFPKESNLCTYDIKQINNLSSKTYQAKLSSFLPRMTRLTVDIQLEILVFVNETTSFLENGKMSFVTLGHHVKVVSLRQLGFHLDHLAMHFWLPNGVGVRILT